MDCIAEELFVEQATGKQRGDRDGSCTPLDVRHGGGRDECVGMFCKSSPPTQSKRIYEVSCAGKSLYDLTKDTQFDINSSKILL